MNSFKVLPNNEIAVRQAMRSTTLGEIVPSESQTVKFTFPWSLLDFPLIIPDISLTLFEFPYFSGFSR